MLKRNFIFFTILAVSAYLTFTKDTGRDPASAEVKTSAASMKAMASNAGY